MKQTITIKALVKKDQKVLLIRASQTGYRLPGCLLELGQDPKVSLHQCVLRQLHKEVHVAQLFDVVSYVNQHGNQEIAILFLVALAGREGDMAVADGERYVWKKLSDIQSNEVDEITKIALKLEPTTFTTGARGATKSIGDEKITTEIHKDVIVYTDGGSRGNPGPSAAGFVILGANDELLFEGGKYLGITTNNQAEYQAVRLGLEKALELGAHTVKFRMDSLLIVNQMIGLYKIRNRDLWPIYANIKELTKKFDSVTFSHVRREFNREADALVNKVLDEQKG